MIGIGQAFSFSSWNNGYQFGNSVIMRYDRSGRRVLVRDDSPGRRKLGRYRTRIVCIVLIDRGSTDLLPGRELKQSRKGGN